MEDTKRLLFDKCCEIINLIEEMKGYGNIDDEYIDGAYKDAMILSKVIEKEWDNE